MAVSDSNNHNYNHHHKRPVGTFLQERWRAMDGCRFKPENYHEIPRVLGARFAPDLNRVTSKHRADAASAYLRRLQRDVERSQGGYYDQLHALPLQIKRLRVNREDPRSFKSVLIPKLKLSPLPDPSHSPRTLKSQSPKVAESPSDGEPVAPPVVQSGSSYVPHKSFSPHSHTHIHVLFKQVPGQISHKKGASSVVSSEVSGTGGSSVTSELARSFKAKQSSLRASKLPGPWDKSSPREEDEDSSEHAWPAEDLPQPFSMPKFSANASPLPHIKKRLGAVAAAASATAGDKTPRSLGEKSPRTVHNNNSNNNNNTRSVFRSPRLENPSNPVSATWKSDESSAVTQQSSSRDAPPHLKEALPPNVAAALAAGSSTSALYKLDLPHELATAYDKNLPTTERPKAMVLGSRASRGLPMPSIPNNVDVGGQMLAITSVQHSNAIQMPV